MPNFLIVGFSGRKEAGRDPSVLGQVADLSLSDTHKGALGRVKEGRGIFGLRVKYKV